MEQWNRVLDLYCERTGPGFWAEPLNAFSNAAFLIAAWAAWRSAKRREPISWELEILIGLAVTIGLGSFVFHTLATVWAMYLDIVPILVFQLGFVWVYAQQQIGLNRFKTSVMLLILLTTSIAGIAMRDVLNGSLMYVPAWLLLAGLGFSHLRQSKNQPRILILASGVFLLSLVFRTIDHAACDLIPCGTHFLWHLCNGLLIYLVLQSLIQNPVKTNP